MSKYTPTPWIKNGRFIDAEIARGVYDRVNICSAYLTGEDGEREANVEHIVRCVNSHDDLLEACRLALNNAREHILPSNVEFIEQAIAKATEEA